MRRTKGFTLIELLVVIAIIGLLVSILVPSINMARKLARRAACMANLNGIGKAIIMYTNLNEDMFPLIKDDAATGAGYADDLNNASDEIEDLAGPMVDNLCLLIQEGNLQWKMFICPGRGGKTMTRGDNEEFGFNDGDDNIYCHYSLHMGYSATGDSDSDENPASFSGDQIDEGAAILADDADTVIDANSLNDDDDRLNDGGNHGGDVINVLKGSANVSSEKEVTCGYSNDNIYTNRSGEDDDDDTGSAGLPYDKYDSVLIPPED